MPQNDPFVEKRWTWSENIREKENNIKIYAVSREQKQGSWTCLSLEITTNAENKVCFTSLEN